MLSWGLLLAMVDISRIGEAVDEVFCSRPPGATLRRVSYV
jgi:hypothetical protein